MRLRHHPAWISAREHRSLLAPVASSQEAVWIPPGRRLWISPVSGHWMDSHGAWSPTEQVALSLAWVDNRRGEPDIYLQRFAASEAVVESWPAGAWAVASWIVPSTSSSDGNAGVFLSWLDYREGQRGRVYAQRIGADDHQSSPHQVVKVSGDQRPDFPDLQDENRERSRHDRGPAHL